MPLHPNGTNTNGETSWTLYVPEEHCRPGLEVGVIVSKHGIQVGDARIPWPAIDAARAQANLK